MDKVWVLDTETKGTGAQMVPLENTQRQVPERRPPRPLPEPRPRPAETPEPKPPKRFKVVDVMTREVLAEGADTRATVDLLEGVRSMVDVTIYVWEPKRERWQLLSLGEQKLLWGFRGR